MLKVGAEAARLSLREHFLFAVTDPDEDEADFTSEVKGFTIERPFAFPASGTPTLVSAYLQDSMRLADRLTGRRRRARGLEPHARTGVAGKSEARGRLSRRPHGHTVRASFGRFFQPPQSENLLLSSSEQARVLSPFASELGSGGADLVPERQSAVETGIDQTLGPVRLDVAYWRRWVRNVADPNVFLGTTIIFPNAVARGWASGIDVRLDVAPYHGWSGFVSYSNSRVQQAGPITGGLFLEDDVAELAEGERFTPDHDQRNVAAAGLSFVRTGSRRRSTPASRAALRCNSATRISTSWKIDPVPTWSTSNVDASSRDDARPDVFAAGSPHGRRGVERSPVAAECHERPMGIQLR